MIKKVLVVMIFCLIAKSSLAECWVAHNIKGKTATSFNNFNITDDSFQDGLLICLTEEGGYVAGNDLKLVRFGRYTLVGVSTTNEGLETINTFQIDTVNMKVYVTTSRIGTSTITNLLPDNVGMFVGDIVKEQ